MDNALRNRDTPKHNVTRPFKQALAALGLGPSEARSVRKDGEMPVTDRRVPKARRATEHKLMCDWFDMLKDFQALAVLVLGPDLSAASDDREVVAVFPDDCRSSAEALARSDAYGAGWRQTNASLVAWTNLPSNTATPDGWMEPWIERGALAVVRVELPLPLGNGFECIVFTRRALVGGDEAPAIAWSALSVWPLLKEAVIAERFDISPRERQIILGLAQGKTAKEAAGQLGLTERTIDFHLHNLMNKLHAANRTAVVQRACSLGLI